MAGDDDGKAEHGRRVHGEAVKRGLRCPFVLALALLGTLVGGLAATAGAQALRIGQAAPELMGESWINSPPLTTESLRGRVVLVDFWTYG
jgi:hypothetical protein